MLFYVTSSSPLPEGARVDAIHFDSERTTCTISDAIPGGYGALQLGWGQFLQGNVTGFLANPLDFVDLGHIQVFAQDEKGPLIFEGRIQDIDSPTGSQATAVTATGYGVGAMAATTDAWYSQSAYTGEPSIGGGQLLREIIQGCAPLLVLSDLDAMFEPGGSYLRSGQAGRYPNQTIDEVVKAGDSNNNQIVFAVFEDRIVTLVPRIPPTDSITGDVIADYYIPFDRRFVQWRRSFDKMVAAVAVQFADGNAGTHGYTSLSSEQEQKNFMDAHGGLWRGYLVSTSNWTQAQAEFFRDTYLERYKSAVITLNVNLSKDFMVQDAEGGYIPNYLVRSGKWIKVGTAEPLLITSSRKDLQKDTNTIVASNV